MQTTITATYIYHNMLLIRMQTKILTEKVLVKGNRCVHECYKITGFEGILTRDKLPGKYLIGEPNFFLYESDSEKGLVFDGKIHHWTETQTGNCMRPKIDLTIENCKLNITVPFPLIGVDDVWEKNEFGKLMGYLKAAGSRLAEIRRKERESWQGPVEFEI